MKAYAITDIGKKRSFNQDYAWMTTDEIGKLPNLFIVADGMYRLPAWRLQRVE